MRTVLWLSFVLSALSAAGEVVLTKPGQNARLNCGINKNSFDRVTWYYGHTAIIRFFGRSGAVIKDKGNIGPRTTLRGENLEISRVKEGDAGAYVCEVDGKRITHTLLVVSVSANPSADLKLGDQATLQCRVGGLNPGTTVQWQRPDGSKTGSAEVPLKPVALSDGGRWECVFTYDSVTYKENLSITVKEPVPETAQTTTKKTLVPDCVECTSAPPTENGPPQLLGLSWWMWAAIGVGSVVVFLLVVLVIVLCMRIRRKKRKYQRRQNGHQPLSPRQYCQCNRPTAAAAKPQQGRRREKPLALPRQPLLMESHESQMEERRGRPERKRKELERV
ncbi:CD4-2 molecule%2C tandem duplicate 2 [Xyrichtys novacula]|uniref:CD4-2 molecule, tandem duplicate 2 n=1 Tax=Xyrichtys novacula TaxID=13765 RepID=A0AAV1FN24_XYRNO|nr:CD4-2 molecule%2C tandem duplicate 2 [Xyrichtys novacula]